MATLSGMQKSLCHKLVHSVITRNKYRAAYFLRCVFISRFLPRTIERKQPEIHVQMLPVLFIGFLSLLLSKACDC